MAIDFFQKELEKVFDRFNETFGDTLAKGEERANAQLLIIYIGGIAKKLMKQKNGKDFNLIKEFMKGKAALYILFDKLENETNKTKTRKENESCTREKYALNAGM